MTMAVNPERTNSSTSERALRWIGDLDHEFYDDERNRFVWYEASAIAFQMFLLSNMALVALMLLFGGASALPYAMPLMVVHAVIAIAAIQYSERRYVGCAPERSDFIRARGFLVMALVVLMTIGLARAILDAGWWQGDDLADGEGAGFTGGFAQGAFWGLVSLPAIAVGVAIYKWRNPAPAQEGEFDELEEF